jgi:hypothetical protein
MTIQDQQPTRAAAEPSADVEGVVEQLHVKGDHTTVLVRRDTGSVGLVVLFSDQSPLEEFDRLERSMWVSICRDALIHGTRVRISLRDGTPKTARTISLLAGPT